MDQVSYATHLALFIDVARLGSFSAAARKQRLAVSSVVRRIDALESQLDDKLFIRSTRAIQLTEAGQLLLDRAPDLVDTLSELYSELEELKQHPSGRFRLSCPPSLGRHHLLPVIAKLTEQNPLLQFELTLTETPMNPVTERFDAVVRVGIQPDSGLFATRIGMQQWYLCAAPAYLTHTPPPHNAQELSQHNKVGKLRERPNWGWRRLADRCDINQNKPLRCDDFEAQRQAVLSGIGIGFLPNWLITEDMQRGRLCRLLPDIDAQQEPIYLLRPLAATSLKLQLLTTAITDRLHHQYVS